MELKDYIEIVLRRKGVIFVTLLIALLVAALGTFLMTPTYDATAQMRISTVTAGAGSAERFDITFTDRLMNTYINLAKSGEVIAQLNEFFGLVEPSAISVEALADTELMFVTVTDEDPTRAADISNFLTELLIADARRARLSDNVTIVSQAAIPDSPSSPSVPLNLALAGVLGLIGGLGLAFIFENTDSRLYTNSQIESALMAPTIGRIPSADPKTGSGPFVNMPLREAYRRLGANVVTLSRDAAMQAFVLTSAFPNEGKSTITANLASTLSRIGLKVIVIDCDLYKPSIHRIFNVSNHVGLMNVLGGQVPLSQAIYVKSPDNVHVLASGPVGRRDQSPTPYPYGIVHRQDAFQLEQLGSAAMANLMREMRKVYDIILLDTPPSLEITDSSVLASLVDGMLVVVDRSQAHHVALEEVRQQLADVRATIAGVIINRDQKDVRLRRELEQRRQPYYQASRKVQAIGVNSANPNHVSRTDQAPTGANGASPFKSSQPNNPPQPPNGSPTAMKLTIPQQNGLGDARIIQNGQPFDGRSSSSNLR